MPPVPIIHAHSGRPSTGPLVYARETSFRIVRALSQHESALPLATGIAVIQETQSHSIFYGCQPCSIAAQCHIVLPLEIAELRGHIFSSRHLESVSVTKTKVERHITPPASEPTSLTSSPSPPPASAPSPLANTQGILPPPSWYNQPTPSPTVSSSSLYTVSTFDPMDAEMEEDEVEMSVSPRPLCTTYPLSRARLWLSHSPILSSASPPAPNVPFPTSVPMRRSISDIYPPTVSNISGAHSGPGMSRRATLPTQVRNPHMVLPLPGSNSKLPVLPPTPPLTSPSSPAFSDSSFSEIKAYQCKPCVYTGLFCGTLPNDPEALRLHSSSEGHKQSLAIYSAPHVLPQPHQHAHAHETSLVERARYAPYEHRRSPRPPPRDSPILHMPRPQRPHGDWKMLKSSSFPTLSRPYRDNTHSRKKQRRARSREAESEVDGGHDARGWLDALAHVAAMELD
ncbi:hypothetical protein L198_07808 [Cryptococcus wingfieldii CBS 7118]|uniref:Uncharacterized protein n=1 Tax=Cryptococcus wingfieldii CBS 7118 TaxID=1295528 RepID=A0A1E3HVG7_9TREE|nr:hypothetical protein L198_07808 [Cryptococcus wingfieldii CBS 7118]ODN80309.1 hypothetical protein L198_07808 [Cryptococcus wingfieldii CBS 7118]